MYLNNNNNQWDIKFGDEADLKQKSPNFRAITKLQWVVQYGANTPNN